MNRPMLLLLLGVSSARATAPSVTAVIDKTSGVFLGVQLNQCC